MSSRILTIGAIASAAILGYCVYFDYERRSSPEFRRKLKKNAKKYKKLQVEKEETDKKQKFNSIISKLNESLEKDPLPTGVERQQVYFMEQVGNGERLAASPDSEEDAAIHFYKALAVYPSPAELLTVLQKSIPEPIYELIVFLIAAQPPLSLASILGDDLDLVNGNIKVVNPDEEVQ